MTTKAMQVKAQGVVDNNRLSHCMKCGDCTHFETSRSSHFDKICKQRGIKKFADACKHFTPNLHTLSATLHSDALVMLSQLTRYATTQQLRVLSYALSDSTKLDRFSLQFGQPVYVNLSAPKADYIECYYRAYVLSTSGQGDVVLISSLTQSKSRSTIITLPIGSVLTVDEWKTKFNSLMREKRLTLPEDKRSYSPTNKEHYTKIQSAIAYYKSFRVEPTDIPSIDTVDSSWFDKVGKKTKAILKQAKNKEKFALTDKGSRSKRIPIELVDGNYEFTDNAAEQEEKITPLDGSLMAEGQILGTEDVTDELDSLQFND